MTLRRRFPLLLTLLPATALADRPAGVCVEVAADFTPTDNLQIVAWLEKPDGTYVDTVYITNKTGRFGLGNRPGIYDFNTGSSVGDSFPYGRRIMTFPVWAHKHGRQFPKVVFQNMDERNLSHPFSQSSPESPPPYCRPIQPTEPQFDSGTCASAAFTDKGMFDPNGEISLYPPRTDVVRKPGTDSASVDMYRANNPFDAVSRATPVGGQPTSAIWAAPQSIDYGNYVLVVETSKTYDFNATYNSTVFPPPSGIPWADYGQPWRGQPSIVYRIPFSIADTATKALTDTYAGYGDPEGASGDLRPPDATITTDTPGSGASRFQLVSDGSDMFRVRVRATPERDDVPPSGLAAMSPTDVTSTSARLMFTAPGDDGMVGQVAGYDVRVRVGSPITDANFEESMAATAAVMPGEPGATQMLELTGLLPETDYYVGVRAYDNCFNRSDLATTKFTTQYREVAEVPWCFVATAAYGSTMANDVTMLRRFRDGILERTVLGELAVETYYTFGPAVAGVIDKSEILRQTARGFLAPIVATVRKLRY